ncbi:MAG: type II toxin-antitoxin system HicB family antitoxin [Patescibacteria group bacterium]
MRKIDLKSVVWKEGKYYVSQCLNVDVSSFGKTKKAALDNLREALELYFENAKVPKFTDVERPDVASLTLRHV